MGILRKLKSVFSSSATRSDNSSKTDQLGVKKKKSRAGRPRPPTSLKSFYQLSLVGHGSFGRVQIVLHREDDKIYALKRISKETSMYTFNLVSLRALIHKMISAIKERRVNNILRERFILEGLRHPFICNLYYSFMDAEYLYLVIDFMKGGDLRFHLNRKTFTESTIQFWIAELACALNYIHSQDIIHRDIKPENILLSEDGHACLADFNTAYQIKRAKYRRTSNSDSDAETSIVSNCLRDICGTKPYLAPEVFGRSGYGISMDWWSLGVVLYECLYGRRPFNSSTSLIREITNANPKYYRCNPPISYQAISLCQSFLEPDPFARLGANGLAEVLHHPFLRAFTQSSLESKQHNPVFVPSGEHNYDSTCELEELLIQQQIISGRGQYTRTANKEADKAHYAKLKKILEERFLPYDFSEAANLITKPALSQIHNPTSKPNLIQNLTDSSSRESDNLNRSESSESERNRSVYSSFSTSDLSHASSVEQSERLRPDPVSTSPQTISKQGNCEPLVQSKIENSDNSEQESNREAELLKDRYREDQKRQSSRSKIDQKQLSQSAQKSKEFSKTSSPDSSEKVLTKLVVSNANAPSSDGQDDSPQKPTRLLSEPTLSPKEQQDRQMEVKVVIAQKRIPREHKYHIDHKVPGRPGSTTRFKSYSSQNLVLDSKSDISDQPISHRLQKSASRQSRTDAHLETYGGSFMRRSRHAGKKARGSCLSSALILANELSYQQNTIVATLNTVIP
ncbi:kinase-like domain-containing protein [Lipomyces oligophaga]|uniref:kinase-like domain-containing protein n=1 Tax=Lipomyces oligophaga TaxID=45792 RepID=UPI0034CD1CB0